MPVLRVVLEPRYTVSAVWTLVSIEVFFLRINTEEKAKVVTAVWGTEFFQLLAALATLH